MGTSQQQKRAQGTVSNGMPCSSFNGLCLLERHHIRSICAYKRAGICLTVTKTVGYLNTPDFFFCCPSYNKKTQDFKAAMAGKAEERIILPLPVLKYMQCANVSAPALFRTCDSPCVSGITHHCSVTTQMLGCIWQGFPLVLVNPVLWLQQQETVFNANAAFLEHS